MLELNQIYNMDCIEGMELIDDNSIDLIVTDPPYNINFKPQRGTHDVIMNDNLGSEEFCIFLYNYFKECYRIMKQDTVLISFMGWSTVCEFRDAIIESGFEIKSMPIWIKNNFGIGYYTRPQYEPMYLCFKGTPEKPEKAISDVIRCDKVYKTIHSCQKPEELIGKLIKTFSKAGSIVFDGFIGSGTTAVAARKLNRQYLGFELDKECYDIAQDRIDSTFNQISLFWE